MARRKPAPLPWTEDEDARLADMIQCGLCVDFYPVGLPSRPLGDMLERRLQLIDAGTVTKPAPL